MKRIHISSSIANFHGQLRERYADYGDFKWFSKDPTIFFGFYHIGDYLRLLCHMGPTKIFWCGSDIKTFPEIVRILMGDDVKSVCENTAEAMELMRRGIHTTIQPQLLDDPEKYQTSYVQSGRPKVWITTHPKRAKEYGVDRLYEIARQVPEVDFAIFGCGKAGVSEAGTTIDGLHFPYILKNVTLYDRFPTDEFDRWTSRMQATIRFNAFDGFSENLAKAVLRGQYAYSVIPYPDIESARDDAALIASLKELKNKSEPKVSIYWRDTLSNRVEI